MRRPYRVETKVRLYFGEGENEWIDLFPSSQVEQVDDLNVDLRVTGRWRLIGTGPEDWQLRRLSLDAPT